MKQKTFNKIAAIVFLFAGALHLVRVFAGWDMVIDGFLVPVWVSLLVGIITIYLAYTAIRIK